MASEGKLVGPFPAGADPESYDRLRRRVLWTMPSGIYLLGSRSGDLANLMTLNWATQVSLEPKHLAVSVERSAFTHGLVDGGGCFAVSVLRREDRALVRKFVKPCEHDASARTLAGFSYVTAVTGAPIPTFAAAYLDCEVRERLAVGSHTVFVGEVVDAGVFDSVTLDSLEVLRMEDTRMSYGG
jgi:flavin reductase (DIM6/NTAB) family NADH-FMN oxidoreductase RutF